MQMEPQVPSYHESGLRPESIVSENGGSGVINSLQDHAAPQQPVKKQTRQWAAWTHQEEENFFSALRQVGKNFEKITCRVQSKNKDQVRHYYYRLVRRMNKLLGPELWLDAKNSKDTNAAMLRWWSLLEKYSCKASKLHLKPRRFKLIVETLENQLLKDRKKTVRKRSSQVENSSLNLPTSVFDQGRVPVHESRPVKPVVVDSQNIQKFGTGKGSSIKRQVNMGINRSNYKADASSAKSSKHRRKTVGASAAAYKRWEKAAIAGVSLVADAAEHLERTSTDKEVEHVQDVTEQNGFDYGDKDAPSLPNNLPSSMKLKLQLFPIDENTRRALEMDNRNPYLELTLSTRKKIPSVLEHLNRKWGTSSVASGDLMLFPYNVQNVNMVGYHRWTKDSTLSAADVYALIGSPPVFRLRYGWFLHSAIGPVASQLPLPCSNEQTQRMNVVNEDILDSVSNPNPQSLNKSEKNSDLHKDPLGSATKMSSTTASSVCTDLIQQYCMPVGISRSSDHAPASLLDAKEGETATVMEQDKHQGDSGTQKAPALSAGEWADSLTNISIGDLLESSGNDEVDCVNSHWPRISGGLPQIPFSCDSFDDAIAAHIRKHENRTSTSPPLLSHASSIWDAEETCDAFSFQKNVFSEKVDAFSKSSSLETFREITQRSSAEPARENEELTDVDKAFTDDPVEGHLMDKCESDGHTSDSSIRDLNGLTDIYWPDSLGPLDLDIPSCRYHNDDLILSDSLGGLSRLIASSLDAFQNCSFFGSERKDSATVQAGESASVPNVKMGTEV